MSIVRRTPCRLLNTTLSSAASGVHGDDLARHLARIGSNGLRTQEKVLGYHTKAGRLRRIRQGMYAVIPPGANGDTYPVDPYLVAAKLTPDAVLSHHTALEFHGWAYSVWQHFIYSAERPTETLIFRDQVFRGARFPRGLVHSGAEFHGVLTAERFGVPLRVTSLERTLVDVLHRPDLAGGWEEVWRSLEGVVFFNLDEVVAHALLLDNATTAARVGFYLDQHRESLMVEDDHLKALEQCRPRQPHYLERSKRGGGQAGGPVELGGARGGADAFLEGRGMRISSEKLIAEAQATGFRPDVLEKVAHLLGLLDAVRSHPFLRNRLALKGGTALNLFVDIDLDYVGAESRSAMLEERPRLEEALQAVFGREDFTIRRMPSEHAGGKWSLRYPTAAGQTGRIDVDVNYMYRVPLWPVRPEDSRPVGSWQATSIPVRDLHELAAGKLAALLSRHRARDLFDCRQLLMLEALDRSRLRIAFVVYGAMNRRDWRTVAFDDAAFDPRELSGQLLPSLPASAVAGRDADEYGRMLVADCRTALSALLPFDAAEEEFLSRSLDHGEIDGALLTKDTARQHQGLP